MPYRNPLTGETSSVPIVSPGYAAWLHTNAKSVAACLYKIGDQAQTLRNALQQEVRLGDLEGVEALANGRAAVDDIYATSLPSDVAAFTARNQRTVTQWLIRSVHSTRHQFTRLQEAIGVFNNAPEISAEERTLINLAQTTLNNMRKDLDAALTPFPALKAEEPGRSR